MASTYDLKSTLNSNFAHQPLFLQTDQLPSFPICSRLENSVANLFVERAVGGQNLKLERIYIFEVITHNNFEIRCKISNPSQGFFGSRVPSVTYVTLSQCHTVTLSQKKLRVQKCLPRSQMLTEPQKTLKTPRKPQKTLNRIFQP